MRAFLRQRWFLLALVGLVAVALAWPAEFGRWTDWLEPRLLIAVALFLIALTMPARSLADELRKPWAALWAVAISYGFLPAAGWLLGQLAPLPDITVGLLLAASVPCTLASAVLWTRLAGGNEATALLTVLVSTLSSWLVTTTWLTATTGTALELSPFRLMGDLVLTLVVPVVVGQGLRAWTPLAHFAERRKNVLGVLSQVLILSIVLKAGSNVGLQIRHSPGGFAWSDVFISGCLAILLHVMALAAGFWSSVWLGFDRGRQVAVAISCSQKTLPVSLFLFLSYFKDRYPLAVVPLLFYHVGQLVLDTFIADRLRARGVAALRSEESTRLTG